MGANDLETSKTKLQEYLLLIFKIPEKLNKIDIDIKKELILEIEERKLSLLKTINFRLIACKHETFEYAKLNTSQLFNLYELEYLDNLIQTSIDLENKLIDENKNDHVLLSNPYPLIFISGEVFECFSNYIAEKMLNEYLDYSYLKKRMQNEKLIHKITDIDFFDFLVNKLKIKLLSRFKETFEKNESKFFALSKCYKDEREEKFNRIFESVLS